MDHLSSVANIPPVISRDRGLNLSNVNRPITSALDPFQAPRPSSNILSTEPLDRQDYGTLNAYQPPLYQDNPRLFEEDRFANDHGSRDRTSPGFRNSNTDINNNRNDDFLDNNNHLYPYRRNNNFEIQEKIPMSRGSSLGHLGAPSNIHNLPNRNQPSYTGRSNVSSNN